MTLLLLLVQGKAEDERWEAIIQKIFRYVHVQQFATLANKPLLQSRWIGLPK